MFICFLLLINYVLSNPTTCLDEAGICYLAYEIMIKQKLSSIEIEGSTFNLDKLNLDKKSFLSLIIGDVLDGYRINFNEIDILDWQNKLNSIEPAMDKYMSNHPLYYTKNDKIVIEANNVDKIEFKDPNIKTKDFEVKIKNVFKMSGNLKFGNIITLLSSIVNEYGDSNQKDTMRKLGDKIYDSRIKKVIAYGEIYSNLKDDVKSKYNLPGLKEYVISDKKIKGKYEKSKIAVYIKDNFNLKSKNDRVTLKDFKDDKKSDNIKSRIRNLKSNVNIYNNNLIRDIIDKVILNVKDNFRILDSHYDLAKRYKSILMNKDFFKIARSKTDITKLVCSV